MMKIGSHKKRMAWCEIVRVDSPLFLVNSRHRACHYETGDGKPLAPGYYLALWPADACRESCRESYGRELRYLGPFATRAAAQFLQTSARGLGIIELTTDTSHIAIPTLLLRPDSGDRPTTPDNPRQFGPSGVFACRRNNPRAPPPSFA
jgi:hypothetical protein